MILPINCLSFDVLCEILLIVALFKRVVRGGLLLAGDEGRLFVLRSEEDVFNGIVYSNWVCLNHLFHLLQLLLTWVAWQAGLGGDLIDQ